MQKEAIRDADGITKVNLRWQVRGQNPTKKHAKANNHVDLFLPAFAQLWRSSRLQAFYGRREQQRS